MTSLRRLLSAQALLLASLGLAAGKTLAAQNTRAPAIGAGSYRISGQAVNADSGAPLGRTEVAILTVVDGMAQDGDQSSSPRRFGRGRRSPTQTALESVTTGDDGSFSFDKVPAGKYSLRGSHRGFLSASYQEHGFYSTAIVVGAGLPTEGLTLKLSPGASIGGSVIDSAGDSPEEAQISLYRLSDDGLGNVRSYRTTNADDLGGYEFAHLPPGTYFVAAKAHVWYASMSSPQAGSAGQPGEAVAKPEPVPATNLDVAYPRTFYANASDSSAATPIPVRGGDHLRIDLHLQAVTAVHLTYSLPAVNSSVHLHSFSHAPALFQSVFGERDSANTSVASTDDHGKQTLSVAVAPGEYEVEMDGRTLVINAAGDTVLDPAAGAAFTEVSGRIAAAPGATLPESVEMVLQDTSGSNTLSTAAHDGAFHFDEVHPGIYEIAARTQSQLLAIVEAAASGASLEGHVMRVGTQPVTLAATLAPASALVSGFARSNSSGSASATEVDETASGAMIVLVPQHLGDHALYRLDQADSDGSFTLRQIAPGRYSLVAIRDGWDLDWARPEVIAHYLPAGQAVTVTTAETGTLRLTKPVMVQSR